MTLSHANLLAAAETLVATEDVRQTDETLAWLPMAWFGDALSLAGAGLSVGFTCNCPENPETARRDLREIGPTILIAPPRIWETTLADIETRAAQATRMKRALFAWFRAIAERVEQHRAGRRSDAAAAAPEARAGRGAGLSRRCAIRSACAGCAGPIPAASRSRRRCCTPCALSAST